MEEATKLKNIYDLDYQTKLNYFNIIVISVITSFVTIILGVSNKFTFLALFSFTLILGITIILIWLYFYGTLKKIKKKIYEL